MDADAVEVFPGDLMLLLFKLLLEGCTKRKDCVGEEGLKQSNVLRPLWEGVSEYISERDRGYA